MIEVGHLSVQFLAQGGNIGGQADVGVRESCLNIGLALRERYVDTVEYFTGFYLDIAGDYCREDRTCLLVNISAPNFCRYSSFFIISILSSVPIDFSW